MLDVRTSFNRKENDDAEKELPLFFHVQCCKLFPNTRKIKKK
jgi:hypothetical protein